MKNTPEDVLAIHALATENFSKITNTIFSTKETALPPYTIWVSQEEDLHNFVFQIPDLAWEMIEYAEEPLEIIYPKRKFISPLNESHREGISIRLVRGQQLQTFVKRNGPLITFRSVTKQNAQIVDEVHDLQEKESSYLKVKSMKIFDDGSFTFVR